MHPKNFWRRTHGRSLVEEVPVVDDRLARESRHGVSNRWTCDEYYAVDAQNSAILRCVRSPPHNDKHGRPIATPFPFVLSEYCTTAEVWERFKIRAKFVSRSGPKKHATTPDQILELEKSAYRYGMYIGFIKQSVVGRDRARGILNKLNFESHVDCGAILSADFDSDLVVKRSGYKCEKASPPCICTSVSMHCFGTRRANAATNGAVSIEKFYTLTFRYKHRGGEADYKQLFVAMFEEGCEIEIVDVQRQHVDIKRKHVNAQKKEHVDVERHRIDVRMQRIEVGYERKSNEENQLDTSDRIFSSNSRTK